MSGPLSVFIIPNGMVLALALAGCTTPMPEFGSTGTSTSTTTGTVTSSVSGTAVVQSVEAVPRQHAGLGLGTLAGAVVGGVLGNQIGQGRGNTAATLAGAAGGALAGNEIEKSRASSDQVYRITLRTEDGVIQSLIQETAPNVRVGDRVRVIDGVIERR